MSQREKFIATAKFIDANLRELCHELITGNSNKFHELETVCEGVCNQRDLRSMIYDAAVRQIALSA